MKNIYLEKSLGIDIREHSVCLTLLGKTLYRTDILASKYITIQPLAEGNESEESAFLEQVNQFMIEHDAWTENVVVSIPRSQLTLQSFELPSPDRKSVDSMISFELEKHFSSSLDNFYYSSHITTKEANQYHIACASVNKEIANYYLNLLKKLNLNVSILDVSTFANLNLLWTNNKNEDPLSVLVELNSNFIDISIIINRELELSRNIQIDDLDYRKCFLNIESKSESHVFTSEKTTKILIEEIKNALASCKNIDDSKLVDAIYISGGGHLAPHLTSKIESMAKVQVFNLQLPSIVNPKIPKSFSEPFMLTSLGLAIRELKQSPIEVNILPGSLILKKKKKINIKTTVGLALATVFFVIGFITSQNIQNKNILTSLEKQLDEIKAHMGPLEKVDLEYETLQKYTNALNKIDVLNPTKLPLLVELSQIIPKDTWIKKIQFKKEKTELKGVSKNASQLVPIIEKSSHFRDTHFVGTIITESIGEKFTIKTVTRTK